MCAHRRVSGSQAAGRSQGAGREISDTAPMTIVLTVVWQQNLNLPTWARSALPEDAPAPAPYTQIEENAENDQY
jgi:hypothetical protein